MLRKSREGEPRYAGVRAPTRVYLSPGPPALTAWEATSSTARALMLPHRCDFVSQTLGMTPRSSGAPVSRGQRPGQVHLQVRDPGARETHVQNRTQQGLTAWLGPLAASLHCGLKGWGESDDSVQEGFSRMRGTRLC